MRWSVRASSAAPAAGAYARGRCLLRFAGQGRGQNLIKLAAPALKLLARETGETINLAVPGVLGAEHLAQRDSSHFVSVTNWVGRRVPHHVAANGKVFMAFGAAPLPDELDRLDVSPRRRSVTGWRSNASSNRSAQRW